MSVGVAKTAANFGIKREQMHESEVDLLRNILDEAQHKCPHLKIEEGVFNYVVQCDQIKEDLGLHELQLWCLTEKCKNCIYCKKMTITWDQLNYITLDVADLLKKKHGIDGFQYHEMLNFLRSNLSRSLDFIGYQLPGSGYVDWNEARKERGKL
jgi:hypothetical protein